MRHVKLCFPRASDAVVDRWIEKGYVDCERRQRGTLGLFFFNILDICHIGVLLEASRFGVLQSRIPLIVQVDVEIDAPIERKKSPLVLALQSPDGLTELYDLCKFDLMFRITGSSDPFHVTDRRNKRTRDAYRVRLQRPSVLAQGFLSQVHDPSIMRFYPEHTASLFIHVGLIAYRVGQALEIQDLWIPHSSSIKESRKS